MQKLSAEFQKYFLAANVALHSSNHGIYDIRDPTAISLLSVAPDDSGCRGEPRGDRHATNAVICGRTYVIFIDNDIHSRWQTYESPVGYLESRK